MPIPTGSPVHVAVRASAAFTISLDETRTSPRFAATASGTEAEPLLELAHPTGTLKIDPKTIPNPGSESTRLKPLELVLVGLESVLKRARENEIPNSEDINPSRTNRSTFAIGRGKADQQLFRVTTFAQLQALAAHLTVFFGSGSTATEKGARTIEAAEPVVATTLPPPPSPPARVEIPLSSATRPPISLRLSGRPTAGPTTPSVVAESLETGMVFRSDGSGTRRAILILDDGRVKVFRQASGSKSWDAVETPDGQEAFPSRSACWAVLAKDLGRGVTLETDRLALAEFAAGNTPSA